MAIDDSIRSGFVRVGAFSDLLEGGLALRFDLLVDGVHNGFDTGFVIRFDGACYGFINRCPHAGTELDWAPGQVFDLDRQFLTCSTHGALFDPKSGVCRRGPCINQSLTPLEVKLNGDDILVRMVKKNASV